MGASLADSDPILVPFLKWAGGKRWLASNHSYLFPKHFQRYVEPFLGSAAIYFHLRPKTALLSDRNSDLVNVYEQIKGDWTKVFRALKRHQKHHNKNYYYRERDRLHRVPHERAAQFIYLNRTCWNGLYRVNRQGKFNVPVGTKSAVLLPNDNFQSASNLLRNANVIVSDFEQVIDDVGEGDFLFLDPPYVTRHNLNGFRKYNETLFTWDDQIRLAMAIRGAAHRGALILLTNANHLSIISLYSEIGLPYKIHALQRHSVLAADASQRGPVSELALTINYETPL